MAHHPGKRYLCEWDPERPIPPVDRIDLLPDDWAGGVLIDRDCVECLRRVAVIVRMDPDREYASAIEGRRPLASLIGEAA